MKSKDKGKVEKKKVAKIKNKKGILPIQIAAIPLAVQIAVWGSLTFFPIRGLVETAQNGVLKKNVQTIWCKMANKGEAFCNAKYDYQVK